MIRRFLQQWFNIPPWKNAEYIKDDRGEKFWVSWNDLQEDVAKIRLRYRSYQAGHVNINEENDTLLTLADIHVANSYRGRGLGKQMINRIIQWAKQSGYQEISGVIKPSEEVTLEYLQEWYKRQGFKVEDRKLSFDLTG